MGDLSTGTRGEELAVRYLEAKGYRVLDRNYRFERNEVDIVCYDPEGGTDHGEIVFVEVKTRTGTAFGHPEESVDTAKQRRVVEASRAYLYEQHLESAPCRFDVVSVLIGEGEPAFEHFTDAFWA